MDQINTGTLKLKQYAAGSHVQGTRTDFSVKREEPIFDALIGQKKERCRSEVVEKGGKPEPTKKDTTTEEKQETTETVEKPVAGNEEEETCDIAREAAAAQIVWYVEPNAIHLKAPEQMERVAVIEKPMVFGITDEPAEPIEAILETKLAELTVEAEPVIDSEQMPMSELTTMAEPVIEQNAAAEFVQTSELETNINVHETERAEVKVDTDGEENGAEAASVEMPLFEDVEAAPIKVAEAPARAENSEPVEQQVAVKLSDLITSGETKVQIQLEPVELGKLTIELTRSADGTLSVVLDAENAQTRSLLEKHIGTLQETLVDRGQRAVQITVEHNEESQRQDNQQREDFYDGRNGQHSEQQQRRDAHRDSADFMQQLRLGLIPLEDEENT